MPIQSYNIVGVRVDDVTREETLEQIEKFMSEPGLHQIVTPNIDHILHAQSDEEFRVLVNQSALSVPDGKWLMRGSRLAGIRLREGVTGRLLVEPMCERAAKEGWSIYILASVNDVAHIAGERLREKYPGLKVAGTRSPSMQFGKNEAETASILWELNELKPDILFLGVGAPKSEKWIYRFRDRLPSRVAIGVGYAFDVIAGRISECPAWMTRTGMEWAYRLLVEPKRLWKRYLVRDPKFFALILRQRFSSKSNQWTM
jgi:N-acetylglucosaminyldiphosphoundecaprenol N-acetyl-beta-D-mannosaminyltransferase